MVSPLDERGVRIGGEGGSSSSSSYSTGFVTPTNRMCRLYRFLMTTFRLLEPTSFCKPSAQNEKVSKSARSQLPKRKAAISERVHPRTFCEGNTTLSTQEGTGQENLPPRSIASLRGGVSSSGDTKGCSKAKAWFQCVLKACSTIA
jgi:hypothetical protein